MTYTATTFHEVTVEWDFDVDPGYPGDRVDPPEPPTVQNYSATIIGPRGERLACPDWLVALMFDEPSLLVDAEEQCAERAYDYADARMMRAAE